MNSARIYLDHAATSWPKPEAVLHAMDQFARQCGSAAGRGSYQSAIHSGEIVTSVRREIAREIRAADPGDISLHASGTAALNAAIHGLLRCRDHVVVTAADHNSVLRPVHHLQQQKEIDVTVIPCDTVGAVNAKDVIAAVNPRTRLVAITHASNVTGTVQPIESIADQLPSHALLLCDAAQTFGYLPIDVVSAGIDLLAAPGHKGGRGPLGTGFLYAAPSCQDEIEPLIQGGTGSQSESLEMPVSYPEKLEAGNLNVPALAGWAAGMSQVDDREATQAHLAALAIQLHEGLSNLPGLRLHGQLGPLPTVSLSVEGTPPADVASILDVEFGVEARAGLHCAALIHQHLGTLPEGTLRLSAGTSTTTDQIERAVSALREITTHLAPQDCR